MAHMKIGSMPLAVRVCAGAYQSFSIATSVVFSSYVLLYGRPTQHDDV